MLVRSIFSLVNLMHGSFGGGQGAGRGSGVQTKTGLFSLSNVMPETRNRYDMTVVVDLISSRSTLDEVGAE